MPKRRHLIAIVAAGCLVAGAPASAATTIGADVNHSFGYTGSCSGGMNPLQRPCTYVNFAIPDRTMVAPCDGTVVRFRLNGIPSTNTYRLRAVHDNLNGTFTPVATSSPPVTIPAPGVNEFSASMPIKQGDYVGLDFMDSDQPGVHGYYEGGAGIVGIYFYTFPADGTADAPTLTPEQSYYLYNADVECGTPATPAKKCKKKKKGKKKSAAAAKKKKKGCKKKKKGKRK